MGSCGNQDLLAAAAALSVAIAQGRTAEELELLSALFEILGDNLSLLALQAPSADDPNCHTSRSPSPDTATKRCSPPSTTAPST